MTEDETVGWDHQPDGHELEQTPGDSKGQEAWCATVHGVSESWTGFSEWKTSSKMYITEETANNSLVTLEKELKKDFPYLLSKLLIKLI